MLGNKQTLKNLFFKFSANLPVINEKLPLYV